MNTGLCAGEGRILRKPVHTLGLRPPAGSGPGGVTVPSRGRAAGPVCL